MCDYYLHLRTPAGEGQLEQRLALPNLDAALIAAHQVARRFIHDSARRGGAQQQLRGSLDVEDEWRRPVAKLMLADVARQIS